MTPSKLAIVGILGIGLLATPLYAQTAEDLKKAVEKLDKATKELTDAREALKTDELRSKAIKMDTTLELIDKDIQEIKKDIRDIKRKLELGSSTSSKSQSLYQGQGRVRFINEYSEEMSVVVNGRSYRLVPGQERLIAIPAGDFTYQVLQLQRYPQERKITSDEIKTVRIYPLP